MGKTFTVAFLLCLVCSLIVAGSVVALKPIQQENKALNLKANILAAAGLLPSGASKDEIEAQFEKIDARLVDLDTGEYVDPSVVGKQTALAYDQRKAQKDPKLSDSIPSEEDIASIKRRVDFAKVYLVRENEELKTIILPVSGYGLWSTLHGFLALEADANTVVGFGFYEHAETPGLGGEVDNPNWKALWPGKKVYDLDESDEPKLALLKGAVDRSKPDAEYKVDGLSGATLTSRGVTNLVQYWTGEHGFQKYLNKLRQGA
ncbi:NADH:ubiquinone reductase (Na(+)-transporting) subunit C [Oleiphilus sp. HI0071]|jgi:Na+-transporting NADH:ubiquinone oxidoreductase subunit C|nr:NADH:ubiquinone reductase (Na(+)-transporting) subunit C [Oleiphilus sp. HI0065]KZY83068.1 NADH:ubiquinone reductase (Na(+)-transporting) subunit C [Oleiphilus sp. HI0071]KZY89892.1 NADH:ubiquinone reductase (Na(+)-transporting) subunit C [Oleiphilus sp. HI0073]KZZ09669.1 NADH:ubiquinone reductase (Na(+)-transporting) subunit C [Oleiphilus sp. HI0079]KZZ17129.1 NADH:ubiquinone reductase (Na(+)-transporting) subunit C [Oleiphilus sp. HI0080]KZZ40745.1 NADH:ubiquinone reductase (Na(+)-transpo